jgi:hypothetical protein
MPSAAKARVVRRRAKRYEIVHNCAIASACEKFLRSRAGYRPVRGKNSTHGAQQRNQKPNPEGERWKV